MRQALITASQQKPLPPWVRDVADAARAGGTLVPESTWTWLGAWLATLAETELDLEDCLPQILSAEFIYLQNHARSQDHREWIEDQLHRIQDENPGQTVWFIPVDELLCLHLQDEYGSDGIQLERLVFVGTEPELLAAIHQLTHVDLPVP